MATPAAAARALAPTFGPTTRPYAMAALHAPRLLANALAGALDPLFFPGLAETRLDRPVFVLGNPRSGTTLVHRFLARCAPLAPFEIWEMLFPSLVARTLMGPLIRRLAPMLPPPPAAREIHEAGLLLADTDDAWLLLNHLDGPLYWAAFSAWGPGFPEELTDAPRRAAETERLLDLLDGVWKRNVRYRRKPRVLAKSSLATGAVPALLRRYPDARLLYLLRSPLDVIPSTLSLAENVWVRMAKQIREPTPAQQQAYWENLYFASCRLYLDFHAWYVSGAIPAENLHIVDYRRLTADFAPTMRAALAFAEIPDDPALLAELTPKQRAHRSGHRYTLAQYGLSEERVRRDLAPVFETWGF